MVLSLPVLSRKRKNCEHADKRNPYRYLSSWGLNFITFRALCAAISHNCNEKRYNKNSSAVNHNCDIRVSTIASRANSRRKKRQKGTARSTFAVIHGEIVPR